MRRAERNQRLCLKSGPPRCIVSSFALQLFRFAVSVDLASWDVSQSGRTNTFRQLGSVARNLLNGIFEQNNAQKKKLVFRNGRVPLLHGQLLSPD